jgi:neopullulanase
MALTYLLTIRGIPQLFYGTEILMDNTGHHKNDGLIRSDFPGGWKKDSASAFTGKGLSPAQLDVQNYLKKLLNWRKNNPVIADGQTLHFAPFDGVYVYFRYNKDKTVMVVMNKNKKQAEIETSRFAEILKNKTAAVNILTGDKISVEKNIKVSPETTIIFEVN